MSSYRAEIREGAVSDVESAFSEIETLASEMRETFDNMDGAGMGHLDKCERAGEAADALEQVSAVEPPECVADVAISWSEQVQRRRGRGPSREVRLSNAVALLQAAIEAANEADLVEDDADARDEFVTELENAVEIVEGVEFPGMFG